MGFRLDRSVLDFKQVIFTSRKDEELTVHNTGKVAFDFSVSGSANAVGLFDVTPMQGVCAFCVRIMLKIIWLTDPRSDSHLLGVSHPCRTFQDQV